MTKPMLGMYDSFEREYGDGSNSPEEDFADAESIFHNEWGSSAATTFKPSDPDAMGNQLSSKKRQKFENLYALHNGRGEQSRKHDIRQSHIINDAKVFMSVLDLPDPQRKRVLHILDELDIGSQNFGPGRRYEKIILAICSLVGDEMLSERFAGTGNAADTIIERRLYNRDEFDELMNSVGMTATEHDKIREQIRQKSEYF